MKKLSKMLLLSLVTATTLVGCGAKSDNKTADNKAESKTEVMKGETLLEEQKKGATVIDVRPTAQYSEGHIKDALSIPEDVIEKEIEAKFPKKDTKIILYITLLAYWGVGIPVGYILSRTDWIIPSIGAKGFWVAFIIALTIAAALLFMRMRKIQSQPDEAIIQQLERLK